MNTYLFDLDGTLLDSIELILTSFHHTSRTHLDRVFSDEHWLAGIGTPLRDQLLTIAGSVEERDAMLDTYRDFNLGRHDEMAKPYPGVVDVVLELQRCSAKLALVTSKMSVGANRGLALLGLEAAFPVRVCADDVVHGKPDPEPVLKALEALGSPAADAILIGDSEHDIEAGRRAGVTTAAVTWGPFPRETLEAAGPDLWIERPEDLLKL